MPPNPQQASAAPDAGIIPTLKIVEQPPEAHRFRYESEISSDRLGGCLRGRSGQTSSARIRIGNVNKQSVTHIHILACTVNEEFYPHPYYLHGDACVDGSWRWKSDTSGLCVGGEDMGVNVSLDSLSVIACKKNQKDLKAAIQQRHQNVPKLHDSPGDAPTLGYTRRNLDRIRLAFELKFTTAEDGMEWVIPTVHTDVITDARKAMKLIIEDLTPTEFYPDGTKEIAFYMRAPTTNLKQDDVEVVFQLPLGDNQITETKVKKVTHLKKHLIKSTVPDVDFDNERIKGKVFLRCKDDVTSAEFNIMFSPHKPQQDDAEDRKRKQPGGQRSHH